jgi:hypothetical protein
MFEETFEEARFFFFILGIGCGGFSTAKCFRGTIVSSEAIKLTLVHLVFVVQFYRPTRPPAVPADSAHTDQVT